jgi:hypothetical protein
METADLTCRLIEREHDNVRTALGGHRRQVTTPRLLRLAGALAYFWYYRGHLI